jgi:hypothetical protein
MASIDLTPEQAHTNNLRTLRHIYQDLPAEEVERAYAARTRGSSDVQESVRLAVSDLYQQLHPGKVRAAAARRRPPPRRARSVPIARSSGGAALRPRRARAPQGEPDREVIKQFVGDRLKELPVTLGKEVRRRRYRAQNARSASQRPGPRQKAPGRAHAGPPGARMRRRRPAAAGRWPLPAAAPADPLLLPLPRRMPWTWGPRCATGRWR